MDRPNPGHEKKRRDRNNSLPRVSREQVRSFLDRDPPASPRAEMSLIGSLLLDPARVPEALAIVSNGSMLATERHQTIYDTLCSVYHAHDTVDLVQLMDALEDKGVLEDIGGADYLVGLAESVPAATNAARYASMVREKHQLRQLIDAAGETLYEAYHHADSEGEQVREVLDRAESRIFKVAEDSQTADFEDLGTLLETQIEILYKNEGRSLTGLDSGFYDLNEMTSGLQSGELVIVAARPSMGKTALALNLAENIAASKVTGPTPVAVFSMEMSRGSVAQRLLCARAGVDSQKLRANRLNAQDFELLLDASAHLAKLPLYIDDTPGLTAMLLRAKARRMVQRYDVGAIIIDYLQLMSEPSKARDGRQQEVSEISRSIKALARDLDVPIVCLAQLNRGAEQREGHRPRMADLRESGSIEQDADVIALLHREAYYHRGDPAWDPHSPDFLEENREKLNIAELILAKQRNGPTGTVKLRWNPSLTRFDNLARQSSSYIEPPPFDAGAATQKNGSSPKPDIGDAGGMPF
ncbi:MAG: replicative DNA helicase [Planctomycetota bacterium]